MVSNNRLFDVIRALHGGIRLELKKLRNPRYTRLSERDILFSELPQNPLRVVELAARAAARKHGWDRPQWGIDEESCWVRPAGRPDGLNYLRLIDRTEGDHEAEILAALDLLAQVMNDRNN